MSLVFAQLTSSGEWDDTEIERFIQLDCEVAFRQSLCTDVADEGERVTVLELGDRDDVAVEARSSRNSKVTTT